MSFVLSVNSEVLDLDFTTSSYLYRTNILLKAILLPGCFLKMFIDITLVYFYVFTLLF